MAGALRPAVAGSGQATGLDGECKRANKTRPAILALALLLSVTMTSSTAGQTSRGRPDPEKFPARITQRGVTIAVVPVLDTPDSDKVFGPEASPTRAGFLPVEFVIWSDRDDTIEVELEDVVIYSLTGRFERANPETIARGLYPKPREEIKDPGMPRPSPLPVPLPRRKKKPKKDKLREKRESAEAALRSRELRFGQVPPGSFVRGYLYFDLRGAEIAPADAAVYVSGGREMGTGENLHFAEIPLKPYE